MKLFLLISFVFLGLSTMAQSQQSVDSLKAEILKVNNDLQYVKMNLAKSESKFKRGILIATLGYSITITGGLMLGRKQDDLGKVLLVAGGVTGSVGTVLMLDSFKYLGRAGRREGGLENYKIGKLKN